MRVNTISGASASSRKDGTLKPFMQEILKPYSDIRQYHQPSSDSTCIVQSIKDLNKSVDQRIFLVGKSLGGVRTWWMLKKYWHFFSKCLMPHQAKLGVVLIDPHGYQVGDGKIGSYGVWGKNLSYDDKWDRSDVRIRVCYQRNKYPRGAIIKGAPSQGYLRNTKIADGDHWNLTNLDNPAGKEVRKYLQDMIDWLEK